MLEKILACIKELNPFGYVLLEEEEASEELFFLGNKIELQRAKQVKRHTLTLYKDFKYNGESFLGDAKVSIPDNSSTSEIRSILSRAEVMASYVQNKPYPLAKPESSGQDNSFEPSPFIEEDLAFWVNQIAEELLSADLTQRVSLSAAEIILSRGSRRIITSEGIDCRFPRANCYLETITSAKGTGEEVELFKKRDFSSYKSGELRKALENQGVLTLHRAEALKTPRNFTGDVLIPSEHLKTLFQYYYSQGAAQSVYEGISGFSMGGAFQEGDGDKITLNLLPYLPASPCNQPYDPQGVLLKPVTLLERGIVKSFWGDPQYSHYLGIPVTGALENLEVGEGSSTQEELRGEPYLEAVVFSDFIISPQTGDFGGEIRLAYIKDGNGRIPVTGGSISGNLVDCQNSILFSKERVREENFYGPALSRFKGLTVAGVS